MPLRITPSRAINEPKLLARGFEGPSWDRWRSCLKAAFGEKLDPQELELFQEVAERAPLEKPVREAYFLVGRRGGKDSIAAAIATTLAMTDFSRYLRPGEVATIVCLAVSKDQARIVLNYIRANFLNNPVLAPLVARETEHGLELNNNIEIVVLANNFRSIRGRTILCAIMDECCYWRDLETNTVYPDVETYAALVPSMVTLPDAMLIAISTVYRKSGLAYDKFKAHYGQDDPDVLVIKAPTRAFNPLIPESFIQQQLELDYETNAAEYLSEFRSDIADFVQREVIEAAIDPGIRERPPLPRLRYTGFVDPSGGSSDSMTLGIAHRETDGTAVLDLLRERRPPFSPEAVVSEFAEALKLYRVSRVIGDAYGGVFVEAPFRANNIVYTLAKRDDKFTSKSELYRDALPLLNAGKVRLLDSPRLVAQLCSLERRTARGTGRDTIDHPAGLHDDLANAACGALVFAQGRKNMLDIDPEVLARSARPAFYGGRGPGHWDNGYFVSHRFG
jgi:hypothetical protein